MNNKVVVLDWGIFIHRSIFAWRNNKGIPPTYTCTTMILSALKKIGLHPDDRVIVAVDSKYGSWRKDYEKAYKANRKKLRKSYEDVPWKKFYRDFDRLLQRYDESTSWNIVNLYENKVEADDVMAVCSRYFNDREVILVTYDADLEQCWQYSNVKIFSILKKYKSKKGAYKLKPDNFNAYNVISKKIQKEASDNLVTPILSEEDFNIRETCINLLELPDFIEIPIRERLDNLKNKEYKLDKFPFQKLTSRIGDIYNSTKDVVTYQDCIDYQEKKKKRKKKKKKGGKK